MNVALLEQKMGELRLKPVDVASKTGIALTTVLRILNGESKNPRPLTIRALADLLGITEDQLYKTPPRKRAG